MATLIGEAASHVTTRARRRALVAGYYASFAASISRTEPDLPLNDPEELAAERETLRGVGLPPLRLRIIGTLAALGVAVAVAQFAGAALFPERHDEAIAGLAAGLMLGTLLVWGQGRRAHRRRTP